MAHLPLPMPFARATMAEAAHQSISLKETTDV
jgi:hypothetical protein